MALNLNYQPTPLVDTSKLTNDEWLDWRRRGIGGSDAAAALNQSPYRTARDLYYDKVGVLPVIEGEDKSITFEIGHLLEDVVAQIFAKKTGLTVYEDHTMYQHPLFPFMIADVDRFVLLPDGKKALLECKTAHYNNMKTTWLNGAVPKHYELQVKHYMAVMNIDTAFVACLFSNSESDFVWSRIDRDLEEEESTILQLQDFWDEHGDIGLATGCFSSFESYKSIRDDQINELDIQPWSWIRSAVTTAPRTKTRRPSLWLRTAARRFPRSVT